MDWLRYALLGKWALYSDVDAMRQQLSSLRTRQASGSISQADSLQQLQEENAQIKLMLMALMNLAVSNNLVTREELAKVIDAIDAADGQKDGKFTGAIGPDGTPGPARQAPDKLWELIQQIEPSSPPPPPPEDDLP